MVRALLAGQKTQTRRLAKWPILGPSDGVKRRVYGPDDLERERTAILSCCPIGKPRGRLWVRETWQFVGFTDDGYPFIRCRADDKTHLCERIDPAWSDRLTDIWAKLSEPANFEIDQRAADRVWRPAIFIPRWASRIALEVTGVRLERLQDISEEDAQAEGVEAMDGSFDDVRLCARAKEMSACATDNRVWFAELWDEINGARRTWSANPYVWAVSFRLAA